MSPRINAYVMSSDLTRNFVTPAIILITFARSIVRMQLSCKVPVHSSHNMRLCWWTVQVATNSIKHRLCDRSVLSPP